MGAGQGQARGRSSTFIRDDTGDYDNNGDWYDWDWGEWGDAPPPWWDQYPPKPDPEPLPDDNGRQDDEEEDQRRSPNPVIRHCANCGGKYIKPNGCILPDGNQVDAFMYYKKRRCE